MRTTFAAPHTPQFFSRLAFGMWFLLHQKRIKIFPGLTSAKLSSHKHRDGAKDQGALFPVEDLDTNVGVEVGEDVHRGKTRGAHADQKQE